MREDQLPRIKDRGLSSEAPLEALLGRSSDDPRSTFPTILRTRSSLTPVALGFKYQLNSLFSIKI